MWVITERRDAAFEGSSEVDNPLQERTSIAVLLVAADLRLTDRFGVQAAVSVPDITRTAIVPRPAGPLNYRETFSGLGDTSLVAWSRLNPVHRWNLVVNFGASLPTGRTERPRFRPELQGGNLVPMSRLQRGSGTFDPVFGLTLDRRFRAFTAFGSAAARTPLYENDKGLRTGASWEVGGGVARALGTHRLNGLVRLGWLHREQDVFRGTPVLVGGGDWFYVTPGLAAQIGKGVNLQVEAKIPAYRRLANRQLDSPVIFQFGISRAF